MHPTSLVPRSGKDLVERLPESERTVANGDFRSDRQSPSFHIDEKFAPACALSRTPTWKPMSSFLPSGVAPISTSMHSLWSSMRACRIHRRPTHTGIGAPTNPASANARTRLATPLSDGKSPPATGSAHPCPTAPPRPPGSPGGDTTQIKHRQQRIQALRAPCPQRRIAEVNRIRSPSLGARDPESSPGQPRQHRSPSGSCVRDHDRAGQHGLAHQQA